MDKITLAYKFLSHLYYGDIGVYADKLYPLADCEFDSAVNELKVNNFHLPSYNLEYGVLSPIKIEVLNRCLDVISKVLNEQGCGDSKVIVKILNEDKREEIEFIIDKLKSI